MKKIIWLALILLPYSSFSQLYYSEKDIVVEMNTEVVNYLCMNINRIEFIGKKTSIGIPIAKEFKKRMRLRWVGGYLCQYAWTGTDVTIQRPKTSLIYFDFKNKTIDDKKVCIVTDTVKVTKDKNLYYFFDESFFQGNGKHLEKVTLAKVENNDSNDPFKPSDTKLKAAVKDKDEKEHKKPGTGTGPGKYKGK